MSTIELSVILGLKGVSEAILENEKYTIKSSIPLLFINTQEGNASDHDRGSVRGRELRKYARELVIDPETHQDALVEIGKSSHTHFDLQHERSKDGLVRVKLFELALLPTSLKNKLLDLIGNEGSQVKYLTVVVLRYIQNKDQSTKHAKVLIVPDHIDCVDKEFIEWLCKEESKNFDFHPDEEETVKKSVFINNNKTHFPDNPPKRVVIR